MKKASFCIGAVALLVVIAVGCNNVVKGADNTPVYSRKSRRSSSSTMELARNITSCCLTSTLATTLCVP